MWVKNVTDTPIFISPYGHPVVDIPRLGTVEVSDALGAFLLRKYPGRVKETVKPVPVVILTPKKRGRRKKHE